MLYVMIFKLSQSILLPNKHNSSNPMLWTHLPQITHYWKLQPNMPYNKSRWLHITERKLRKRTHDI